jgi:hypothetical protein
VAGESLVESRANEPADRDSVAYRKVEHQLEQGRALALAAHPTRDLEESTGSVEIAVDDSKPESGPGSLLA